MDDRSANGENIVFWGKLAPYYDLMMRGIAPAYPQVIRHIQEAVKHHEHVLEVATGSGSIAVELARVCDHVEAVDISAPMIEVAWKKAVINRLDNLMFSVQSAYELEFAPNSFDAVVCANALHCMDAPRKALGEIHRVLKPGGLFIAPTFCHGQTLKTKLISRLMSLTGFKAYHRFSIREFKALIREAGFDIQEQTTMPGLIPLAVPIARR